MTRWHAFNPMFASFQRSPLWKQLQDLQGEMNRVFDRWGDGNRPGVAAEYPAVNMWEDADTVFIEAELPGVTPNDLELFVTGGNQLTLKGERKPVAAEQGVWHRQERGAGDFVRILTLPFNVNENNVEARFDNGVLTVKLAKHESAKPRKIVVKGE